MHDTLSLTLFRIFVTSFAPNYLLFVYCHLFPIHFLSLGYVTSTSKPPSIDLIGFVSINQANDFMTRIGVRSIEQLVICMLSRVRLGVSRVPPFKYE